MTQVELAEQHLREADGVADVLAAGWEIFELIGALAAASADKAADRPDRPECLGVLSHRCLCSPARRRGLPSPERG